MAEPEAPGPIKKADLLSSGCAVLNLAMSGRTSGGHRKGSYTLFVGQSGAGKTAFALASLAEASINPEFDNYELIHDDTERANVFNIPKLFGKKLARRLRSASEHDEKKEAGPSRTIEDFYFNADSWLDQGKPIIYVCDSMDGLTSRAELEKFATNKKKWKKGKELEGSYGDGKAKKNSENLRGLVQKFEETGSILIIIAQQKFKLNAMPFQDPATRAGGVALTFYAHVEVWMSVVGKIKTAKEIQGRKRTIGSYVNFNIKKNRYTGKQDTVQGQIYYSYGIDDIQSSIDYLLREKHWNKKSGKINTGDAFGLVSRNKLISLCDTSPKKQRMLREEVRLCWKGIEDQTLLKRKPKYD